MLYIIMKFLTECKHTDQTSRDPSRAAPNPIRPEFKLGIYEFT